MARVRRILKIVAGVFVTAVYVWYRAVVNAPVVRRRKAARRASAGPH